MKGAVFRGNKPIELFFNLIGVMDGEKNGLTGDVHAGAGTPPAWTFQPLNTAGRSMVFCRF
jgi:hypothetical protein